MLKIISSPEVVLLNFLNIFLCPNANIVSQLEYTLRTFVLLYD